MSFLFKILNFKCHWSIELWTISRLHFPPPIFSLTLLAKNNFLQTNGNIVRVLAYLSLTSSFNYYLAYSFSLSSLSCVSSTILLVWVKRIPQFVGLATAVTAENYVTATWQLSQLRATWQPPDSCHSLELRDSHLTAVTAESHLTATWQLSQLRSHVTAGNSCQDCQLGSLVALMAEINE
jgi:hypothetical protein